MPAELVLIAVGFTGVEPSSMIDELGVEVDPGGRIRAGVFETGVEGVYAAGDYRVGAALVVTAIADGRRCARIMDRALAQRIRPKRALWFGISVGVAAGVQLVITVNTLAAIPAIVGVLGYVFVYTL